MVTQHGGDVLGPHLLVLCFDGRDRRRGQAQHVRIHQCGQDGAVCVDSRRTDRGHQRRFERSQRRPDLTGGLLGLGACRGQPRQIGLRGAGHRGRRRTLPSPARQAGGHRPERACRGEQLGRQPIPGRRCRQHGPRPSTEVHPGRIDLRRQQHKTHRKRLLAATKRMASCLITLPAHTANAKNIRIAKCEAYSQFPMATLCWPG
ncbi:hypothetical protein VIMS_04364 [Mycobacterium marinum]|nr:hypothetical protein VIMS_04364 [Mycobacterium marinum]RFZ32999.1 hypothetical protein NCTC2275_02914 [Mycobacterium marinum]